MKRRKWPRYNCPVCGFDKLHRPPKNHAICPCCGTEFDYHDCTVGHLELRKRWISNGADWHSSVTPSPPGWNQLEQLWRAGLVSLDVQPPAPNKTTVRVPRSHHATVRVPRSHHATRPKRPTEKREKNKMPGTFGFQGAQTGRFAIADRIGR